MIIISRQIIALLAALVISALIFIFVISLNDSKVSRDELDKSALNFEVEKKKQIDKPKPKEKPQERKRQTQSLPSIKPSADLSNFSGSGLSFGVPQFDDAEFAEFEDGGLLDSFENKALEDSVVDTKPKIKKRAPIVYPDLARRQGVSGYVTMNVLIDENGDVEDVKIIDSKPDEIFDLKADSTMRRWKFEPATYNGRKVKVWAQQRIVFKLN